MGKKVKNSNTNRIKTLLDTHRHIHIYFIRTKPDFSIWRRKRRRKKKGKKEGTPWWSLHLCLQWHVFTEQLSIVSVSNRKNMRELITRFAKNYQQERNVFATASSLRYSAFKCTVQSVIPSSNWHEIAWNGIFVVNDGVVFAISSHSVENYMCK